MALTLAESDLHTLVDGRVEPDRRADLLRRLAASPSDRALVEAWQEQTETIRTAFSDIEHEPLPVALNLAPPRLRCVDTSPPLRPVGRIRGSDTRWGGVSAAATALVVMVGLAGSWLAFGQADRDGADPAPATSEAVAADRATSALAADASAPLAATAALPIVRLPDLSSAGLRLVDVSTQPGEPATMVLRYREDGPGRVAISVARSTPDFGPTPLGPLGKTVVWRRAGAVFAMTGTLPLERLQAIATSLQDDAGTE